MKKIIQIILFSLILLLLLEPIRLRIPYPNNNYNYYKGVHVSCVSNEFNSLQSKVSIPNHNETDYTQMVNYNHSPQMNIQTYSPYSPFKEKRYINVGTGPFDLALPIVGRINNKITQTNSSETPLKKHNLLIGNRHYNFRLLADGSIDDAIILTNSSNIPFEETGSITTKKNAFGPPMDGSDVPINDAALPLLIFSLIYLVIQLKPMWRNQTSGK